MVVVEEGRSPSVASLKSSQQPANGAEAVDSMMMESTPAKQRDGLRRQQRA